MPTDYSQADKTADAAPDGVTCVRDGSKVCPDDNSCCVVVPGIPDEVPPDAKLETAIAALREFEINKHFHQWRIMGRVGAANEPVMMCAHEGCGLVLQPTEIKVLAKTFFYGKDG